MSEIEILDRIAISVKSHKLLGVLLKENPALDEIMRNSRNETEALVGVREWIEKEYAGHKDAFRFFNTVHTDRVLFEKLDWQDYAIIRLMDYIKHAGREYPDLNLHGEIAVSNPLRLIWLAVTRGTGGAKPDFFIDMIMLFRQLRGDSKLPEFSPERVRDWMERFPSGLDPRIVQVREENKQRIIRILMELIDSGEIQSRRYFFEPAFSEEEKLSKMDQWWEEHQFHLRFAVRTVASCDRDRRRRTDEPPPACRLRSAGR